MPRADTVLNQNYIFPFDAGKPNLCPNFTFGILGPIYVMTLMGFAPTIRLLLLLTVTPHGGSSSAHQPRRCVRPPELGGDLPTTTTDSTYH